MKTYSCGVKEEFERSSCGLWTLPVEHTAASIHLSSSAYPGPGFGAAVYRQRHHVFPLPGHFLQLIRWNMIWPAKWH